MYVLLNLFRFVSFVVFIVIGFGLYIIELKEILELLFKMKLYGVVLSRLL